MDLGQPHAFLETNTYMVGPMVWCEHRHRPWDCVAYTVAAYAGTLFERHQCTIEYGTYIRIISNCNPQELAVHAIWQRVARTRVGANLPRRVVMDALHKLSQCTRLDVQRFWEACGTSVMYLCEREMTMHA